MRCLENDEADVVLFITSDEYTGAEPKDEDMDAGGCKLDVQDAEALIERRRENVYKAVHWQVAHSRLNDCPLNTRSGSSGLL